MKKSILGKSGLEVSAVGLDCAGLSQSYPTFSDKAESIAFLQRAVAMGENFFNTAELYGVYQNEELMGEALEPVRDQVIIATRFDWNIKEGGGLGLCNTPLAIRKAIDSSLKRLRTDHIDLYYQHRVDSNVPIEEVAETMKELARDGKILHWGLSETSASTIRRAHSIFHVTAVQNEYSMWYRKPEQELIPVCEELGIAFVAFSPLGKDFINGTAPNQKLSEELCEFAKERELSPAQIALSWLLHQKPWVVPVPGTKKIEHLQENMSAAYVELAEADWNQLTEMLAGIERAGGRHSFGQESIRGGLE